MRVRRFLVAAGFSLLTFAIDAQEPPFLATPHYAWNQVQVVHHPSMSQSTAHTLSVRTCDGRVPSAMFISGGAVPYSMWYIVRHGSEIRAITSIDDLRSEFAPIETAEEALSFALAPKGPDFQPRFGVEARPDFRYYVPILEDTLWLRTA